MSSPYASNIVLVSLKGFEGGQVGSSILCYTDATPLEH